MSEGQGVEAAVINGLFSLAGNLGGSALNSSRSYKYAARLMQLQDNYNRAMISDYHSLNRQSLAKAGYNPLLGLGSSAQGAQYSPNMMNSDSDAGDQAVNSAINAMTAKANIENVKATTDKLDEETKGVELDNKLKQKQLDTDPKAVVSDLVRGNDTPITNIIKKIGQKVGVYTGNINSSNSASEFLPKVILHNNKPYVQKGVPKSVVKKFNSNSAVSSKKKDEIVHDDTIGVWNSNKRIKGRILSESDLKRFKNSKKNYKYNSPPKNFPSGM